MKKSDLVRSAKDYLSAVNAGLDPVSGDALPSASIGMDRDVREIAGFAANQLGYVLANKMGSGSKPGYVDRLYDSISVLEDLGAGREPGSGNIIGKDDPMGSLRMRRCMSFAADTMGEIFDKARGKGRASFRLPGDLASKIEAVDEELLVTSIVKRVNERNPDPERVSGVQAQTVNDWLEKQGLLGERPAPGEIRRPTAEGAALGLVVKPMKNKDGETYDGVLFPKQAQQFVYDHLGEIAELSREKRYANEAAREQKSKEERKAAAVKRNMKYGKKAEAALGVQEPSDKVHDASYDPWG